MSNQHESNRPLYEEEAIHFLGIDLNLIDEGTKRGRARTFEGYHPLFTVKLEIWLKKAKATVTFQHLEVVISTAAFENLEDYVRGSVHAVLAEDEKWIRELVPNEDGGE